MRSATVVLPVPGLPVKLMCSESREPGFAALGCASTIEYVERAARDVGLDGAALRAELARVERGLDMNRQVIGPGIGKGFHVLVRVGDHDVDVEERLWERAADGGDQSRAHREVRDEMPVHDIDVQEVRAADRLTAAVGGEDVAAVGDGLAGGDADADVGVTEGLVELGEVGRDPRLHAAQQQAVRESVGRESVEGAHARDDHVVAAGAAQPADVPGVDQRTVGGQRLKILNADIQPIQGKPGEILHRDLIVACGQGALLLKNVQPQDRKAMRGADFMNGTHMNVGDILS